MGAYFVANTLFQCSQIPQQSTCNTPIARPSRSSHIFLLIHWISLGRIVLFWGRMELIWVWQQMCFLIKFNFQIKVKLTSLNCNLCFLLRTYMIGIGVDHKLRQQWFASHIHSVCVYWLYCKCRLSEKIEIVWVVTVGALRSITDIHIYKT